MRKQGWILTVLIIIGFLIIQHRSTPSVPMPTTYAKQGNAILVTCTMAPPVTTGETWSLARRSSGQYFVNLYNNQKLVHEFSANKLTGNDSSGSNYTVIGKINFDGSPYLATAIHIDKSGTRGYIEFKPDTSAKSGNQTAG